MIYAALADATLVLHLLFIAFIVLGGILVARWPRLAWAHLPAAAWGVLIELGGWICPLTPLENWLRLRAGQRGYAGSFVEQYLLPIIYPDGDYARKGERFHANCVRVVTRLRAFQNAQVKA